MLIENGSPPTAQDSSTLLAIDDMAWQLQDGVVSPTPPPPPGSGPAPTKHRSGVPQMLSLKQYTCALTTGVDVVVPNGVNGSPDQFNARLYGSVRQLRDGTFMM